jgi:hypothetical protein
LAAFQFSFGTLGFFFLKPRNLAALTPLDACLAGMVFAYLAAHARMGRWRDYAAALEGGRTDIRAGRVEFLVILLGQGGFLAASYFYPVLPDETLVNLMILGPAFFSVEAWSRGKIA